jgi:hypothetical protein
MADPLSAVSSLGMGMSTLSGAINAAGPSTTGFDVAAMYDGPASRMYGLASAPTTPDVRVASGMPGSLGEAQMIASRLGNLPQSISATGDPAAAAITKTRNASEYKVPDTGVTLPLPLGGEIAVMLRPRPEMQLRNHRGFSAELRKTLDKAGRNKNQRQQYGNHMEEHLFREARNNQQFTIVEPTGANFVSLAEELERFARMAQAHGAGDEWAKFKKACYTTDNMTAFAQRVVFDGVVFEVQPYGSDVESAADRYAQASITVRVSGDQVRVVDYFGKGTITGNHLYLRRSRRKIDLGNLPTFSFARNRTEQYQQASVRPALPKTLLADLNRVPAIEKAIFVPWLDFVALEYKTDAPLYTSYTSYDGQPHHDGQMNYLGKVQHPVAGGGKTPTHLARPGAFETYAPDEVIPHRTDRYATMNDAPPLHITLQPAV